jgi:hypothetical protein
MESDLLEALLFFERSPSSARARVAMQWLISVFLGSCRIILRCYLAEAVDVYLYCLRDWTGCVRLQWLASFEFATICM